MSNYLNLKKGLWYDGVELRYLKFCGQQDSCCYVFFHKEFGKFCFQFGRFGPIEPPQQFIDNALFCIDDTACSNCGGVRCRSRVKQHKVVNHSGEFIDPVQVSHLSAHRNFTSLNVAMTDNRHHVHAHLAEASDQHIAIYHAVNSNCISVVGYTLHMHVAAGAALAELQYKRTMHNAVNSVIKAALSGVYLGVDRSLPMSMFVDSGHIDHHRSVLTKVTFGKDSDFNKNFVDGAGLITTERVESIDLVIQVTRAVHSVHAYLEDRQFYPLILENTSDISEMAEHHYLITEVAQLQPLMHILEPVTKGHYYIWVGI